MKRERLWRRSAKKPLPTEPVEYPVGSFVKTEKGYFYILSTNKRLKIISGRVLDSWNPPRIVETSEAAVQRYRVSAKLKFRNGSLIHNLADGRLYLIVEGKRCQVVSPDALTRIGAKWGEATTVGIAEINLHEEGEPLT